MEEHVIAHFLMYIMLTPQTFFQCSVQHDICTVLREFHTNNFYPSAIPKLCTLDNAAQFQLTMCVPPELEQTEQVRRWTLAKGEDLPCSLLSQLWPAVPSTAGDWGSEQTDPATSRCLDP